MSRTTRGWNWSIRPSPHDGYTHEQAILSVLMDIRDELQGIRHRLDCSDTLSIPRVLRRISANTAKPRKKKVKKKRASART